MKTFGEIVREKRKAKGWAQWELAEEIGAEQHTISCWETGRTFPNILVAMQLAEVFDCTIDELIKG